MKYRCIVVDDHLMQRDTLEMELEKTRLLEVVATCANGLEAAQVLADQDIDIVFSDIDMPAMSGLELLKSLKKAPVFVFITAHAEYAVESYNLDVVDFMVKPVPFERLFRSVHKAIEYLDIKKQLAQKQYNEEDANATLQEGNDFFFIRENHNLVKLKFEDVAYIESMGHFSRIYTLNDKKHVTLVSLKNLEQALPASSFIRVHKQHLVNYRHINVIGQGDVTLADKYTVPVGLAYRQALVDLVVGNNKTITRFSG
ncbi:MAG: LytTR family DNA-binding domain-containing protein [Bacteroidota bacterium]